MLTLFVVMTAVSLSAASSNAPTELKTEYVVNPLGIDTSTPRFSWINSDSDRGTVQTAYEIIVASTLANINNSVGDQWDSGKVSSSQQNGVKYAGTALVRRTGYWWKVRVWDEDGNVSSYSACATFETGMISQSDWQASQWIGGDYNLLRDDFVLDSTKTITKARLYVTSLGYNEVYFNGQKAGSDVLNPAYTQYDKRVLYSTYDITSLLNPSNNAIGIMLGSSYYKHFVSSNLAVRAEFYVTYSDGTVYSYGTNPNYFKALKGGPITYDDVYNGERYNATRELPGWSSYGYNDSSWAAPSTISYLGTISAAYQTIRVTEEITQVSIIRSKSNGPTGYAWCASEGDTVTFSQPVNVAFGANGSYYYQSNVTGSITFDNASFGDPISGVRKAGYYQYATGNTPSVYVVDMGVNMAGWAKITVSGTAGTLISLRYAEHLNNDGTIETVDLRGAQATDTYILKGGGTEVWQPRFTYHGFRYVEITGFPTVPTVNNIKGEIVQSNYPMESSFTCSNSLINDIYQMYRRSQRSNTMSIPTDCPSRDERMAAGADAYLTAESACLSFDMVSFYEKCFNDVDDAESIDGTVPDVFPNYSFPNFSDTPWMSQRILIPWEVYMATGDKDILAKHYDKMKLAISHLQALAGSDYLGTPAANGDWVPAGATESKAFFADAYFYRNAVLMAKIAGELGNTSDQATYNTLARNIQNAFNASYFKSNSYYGNNTQAGNAVALDFDIVPADYRNNVLNSLVNNIQSNNNHVTTGILGTKAMMQVLWREDRSDVAFALMNQTTYPSWGYMLNNGPGTLWERWNSDQAIGSGMNSFNHVMFGGGPGAWIYKGIAGISPIKPGYSEILIKPEIVGGLTSASGSVKTVKGFVTTSWTKVSNGELNLNVTLPVNSINNKVYIPTLGRSASTVTIKEGATEIFKNGSATGSVAGVTYDTTSGDFVIFTVSSGSYIFNMTSNDLAPENLALNKTAIADSAESGNGVANGNDGNVSTRWCAADGNTGHWWMVDLGSIYNLTGTQVMWEKNNAYKYKIDVSSNNSTWTTVVDRSANSTAAQTMTDNFTASGRYVRITVNGGLSSTVWASFKEFNVFGTAGPTPGTIYQAETATKSSGWDVQTGGSGWNGTGFVDSHGTEGYIEYTVNVNTAGTYALHFRYASSDTGGRPQELKINGIVVESSLLFPSTGSWNSVWGAVTANQTLNAGSNTIRLTTKGSVAPNWDQLQL